MRAGSASVTPWVINLLATFCCQTRSRVGELHLVVDALDFPAMRGLHGMHRQALLHGHRHDVGKVVLTLCIVVAQLAQPGAQFFGRRQQDAGVHFAYFALFGCGILFLDDALHVALRIAHDAAITGRDCRD